MLIKILLKGIWRFIEAVCLSPSSASNNQLKLRLKIKLRLRLKLKLRLRLSLSGSTFAIFAMYSSYVLTLVCEQIFEI